jgi:GAF domain-containing protein
LESLEKSDEQAVSPCGPSSRLRDPKRLESLRGYAILDTPADPAFDAIVDEAAAACGTPIALVSLIEDDRQWFKAQIGMGTIQTSIDRSICAKAIEYDGVFVVPDAKADPRVNANPLVYGEPHIAFYAGVPLLDAAGRLLGMMCVIDTVKRPQGLDARQIAVLESLAKKVMSLLDERRLSATGGTAASDPDARR